MLRSACRVLAAIFLAFCDPARAGDGRLPAHAVGSPLRNTYWKLTHLGDVSTQTAEQQREAYLIFSAHTMRVSGSGGCNRIMGGFDFDGDKLHLSRMVSTRMACLGGLEQEQRFLQSLSVVERYRINGDHLELLDASGMVVARFMAVALR